MFPHVTVSDWLFLMICLGALLWGVTVLIGRRDKKRQSIQDQDCAGQTKDQGRSTQDETKYPRVDVIAIGQDMCMMVPREASVALSQPEEPQQNVQIYKDVVRNLLARHFDLDAEQMMRQDDVWLKWWFLKGQLGNSVDLHDLIRSDVHDCFKARALIILMLPNLDYSPFMWHDETTCKEYLSFRFLALKNLPDRLRRFAFELTLINTALVLATTFDEKLYTTLFYYNTVIFLALEMLPEADQQMRIIVQAEQEGHASPRHKWEGAAHLYAHHILESMETTQSTYDTDLLASQIEFLIDLPGTDSVCLINNWYVRRLLTILWDNKYKEVRKKIAHYVILKYQGNENYDFKIYSTETTAAAQMIDEEFGEEEPNLRSRIEQLRAEAEQKEQKRQQAHEAELTNIQDVLNEMK